MLPNFVPRLSRPSLIASLLLPVVLIGIPAALAVRAERDLEKSFEWVTHTVSVERAVQNLAASLVDAETGQRGFLLTRREIYLEPYEAGRARVAQHVTDLRNLTADNASQQQRLDELQPLMQERLGLIDETIVLAKRGEHDAALEIVNSDRGKNSMDRIRGLLRVMDDEEHRLLWLRRREAAAQAGRTSLLLFALLGASAAVGGLMFYLVQRLMKVEPVVNMCSYSKTIEYEGEWLSFDEYLRRRFNIATTQSMSPPEFERLRAGIRR